MFLFRLGARRQIGCLLRNDPSIEKFNAIFGLHAFPHGDTLDDLFCVTDPDQMQDVVSSMSETLIRKKLLYPHRLFDKYFLIAIDGTGTLSFANRHCPFCLTKTHDGKTSYYHTVLEAKLVTPSGLAFSIMSEFIENPAPNPTKQDSELKAFYRLAQRLKARFPRLPISLALDGLFAGGPTFQLCRDYGWHFMITLTDKDLPSVNQEFDQLAPLQPNNKLTWHSGKRSEITQRIRWVDDISYVDSLKKEHTLSIIECKETRPDTSATRKTTKFKWVTDYKVSPNNVITLANQGGRIRWKVENEGFNVQKNGGYALEHAYTTNPNSAKIFYFLLQIAHILSQLIDNGSLLKKFFPAGFGSAKNLAFRLLEAWRNAPLTKDHFLDLLDDRIQIRFAFDSS